MLRAREAKRRLAPLGAGLGSGPRARLRAGHATRRATSTSKLLLDLDRTLSAEQREHAVARLRRFARAVRFAGARAMSEPSAARGSPGALERAERADESAAPSYAGRPRDAQLEYKAILANASIGIAFTRDRKFTLCNPKFAEMFGWKAEELIGQPGDVVYPSRESYEAMGAIAVPVLAAGRQLDVEWEVRRKDGSTFLARMIAKAVNAADTQKGTVWIVEDITARKRQADEVARLLREQEAILDTASIGICFVRDRRIVRCNRRFEEMHGYAPGRAGRQADLGRPTPTRPTTRDRRRPTAELARGETYSAETAGAAQGRQHRSGRAHRPRGGSGRPGRGSVWMDEDITEQQARRGGPAARARRAAGDRQQRGDRHRLPARPQASCAATGASRSCSASSRGEAIGMSTRQYYFTDEDFARRRPLHRAARRGRDAGFRAMAAAQGRLGLLVPAHRARARAGQPRQGLRLAVRGHHRAQARRRARSSAWSTSRPDPGQRHGRHRLRARPRRAALQPLPRGNGRRRARRADRHAVVGAVRRRSSEWEESPASAYAQTEPGGTHDIEAAFKRADGTTFLVPHARAAHRRGRRGAGVDLEPGGRDRWSARPRRACSARSSSRS